MDWINILLSAIGGSVASFIGSIMYFRPKLREARAEAKIKEVEAQKEHYDFLTQKIADMEKRCAEQDRIIDELREKILKISEEKFKNDERILKLEGENRQLEQKLKQLAQGVMNSSDITVQY